MHKRPVIVDCWTKPDPQDPLCHSPRFACVPARHTPQLSIFDGVLPVPTPSSYSQGGGGRGHGRQGKQGGRFGREHDEAPRGPSSYFAFKGPNLQLLLLVHNALSHSCTSRIPVPFI